MPAANLAKLFELNRRLDDLESPITADVLMRDALLRAIMNQAPHGLIVCDHTLRLNSWNNLAVQLLPPGPIDGLPLEKWTQVYRLRDFETGKLLKPKELPIFCALSGDTTKTDEVSGYPMCDMELLVGDTRKKHLYVRSIPVCIGDEHEIVAAASVFVVRGGDDN